MVKYFYIIYFLTLFATPGNASENIIEQLIGEGNELQSKLFLSRDINYVRSLVMVNSLKEVVPELAAIQTSDSTAKSYLKFPDQLNLEWNLQLNATRFHPDIWTSEEQDESAKLKRLFQVSKSSHLVLNNGSNWTLYQASPFRLLHSARAPSFNTSESDISMLLSKWLNQNLGYQAIFLKRIKQYLLLISDENLLSSGDTKAIVIKNSRKAAKIQISRAEGSALLRLVKSHEQFGVFEILKAEQDLKIEPGDKVVLESQGQ